MDSLPKIAFHSKDATGSVELTNFRSTALISPAIAWILSGSANLDKGTLQVEAPKLKQSVDFGPVQETVATKVGDGSVSTQVKEDIADIAVKVTGVGEDDAQVNFSARADKALINLGVDGFKSRKAFDLWGLLAAYPARADLAAHEAELKGLLKELAAPGLKLDEGIEAQKAVVTASLGAIALADVKYQLGAANAGPQSSISLSISAEGLSLPVGLVPPNAGALTPSKVDVGATLKGIDIAAAANEWISDLSLQGDGPLLSEDNADKVEAAFLSAGPVQIEFAPSHVVAPAVDADFAGVIRLDHKKPTAAITVHARGFDKTMAAVKALGPDDRRQGDARPGAGQGPRQERKRRQPQLAGRTGRRAVDQGQRDPVRQGAGLSGPRQCPEDRLACLRHRSVVPAIPFAPNRTEPRLNSQNRARSPPVRPCAREAPEQCKRLAERPFNRAMESPADDLLHISPEPFDALARGHGCPSLPGFDPVAG